MIYKKLLAIKSAGITIIRDTKRFNYKYATLDQIQDKLGEVLQLNKLLILHYIKDNKVITKIVDIEDESFIESEIEITTQKPQDKGSEITYYRRYNLLSLLDLEVEDDDGKQAQDSTPDKPWYNDTEKNLETWRNLIITKATTGKQIVEKIEKDFKLAKANKEKILNLF